MDLPARAARRFDVCNGDADGLCAVVQWRLAHPGAATLVTGLKRDIELLCRVPAQAGDDVLVCDVSMARNRDALLRLLAAGVRVRYFDHHAAGEIPTHRGLEAHVDLASGVCTSILVDQYLGGRFRAWAAVGAYGDNLRGAARELAAQAGLGADDCERLRVLGEAINYNAYGDDESDVHIAPARLYAVLARYPEPLEFLACERIGHEIAALRAADLSRGLSLEACWEGPAGGVWLLPDEAWSRRVVGSLANELAGRSPARAHAIARMRGDGTVAVSVRAPLAAPEGAHQLCSRFGGAGRARAAGIDALPAAQLAGFVDAFAGMRWGTQALP